MSRFSDEMESEVATANHAASESGPSPTEQGLRQLTCVVANIGIMLEKRLQEVDNELTKLRQLAQDGSGGL